MSENDPKSRSKITLVLGIVAGALFIFGVLFSIVQEGSVTRIWEDLVVRPSGQFGLRFILQPIVAGVIGIRAGLRDARAGLPPYATRMRADKAKRWDYLMEGLSEVANVVFLSIILDTLYQLIVQGRFYWFETVIVTLLLAFVPYAILRGLVARLAPRQ